MGAKTEKKRGRPKRPGAFSAAQRMRRLRARRKRAGLKVVSRWVPAGEAPAPVHSSHRLAEARSLAMHSLIAERIASDPRKLEIARHNLESWAKRRSEPRPRWHHEWQALLRRPWPEIAALISEPSERAARLRQSSPFAGVLTPQERRRVYDAFRA